MPKDANAVNAQICALGEFDSFGTKKEVKYLPQVLREDETIKALASGLMDNTTWLLCVTDKRLVFLDKGMITGLKQTEIPLSAVTSITHKTGLVLGSITVTCSGKDKKIDNVVKKEVPRVATIISDLLSAAASSAQVPEPDFAPPSPQEELRKWGDLLKDGVISQEDFDAKKKQLLGL